MAKVASTNSLAADIYGRKFSERGSGSANYVNIRRKAVTDPQVIEEVRELSVALLLIESFVFGIAHSADGPLREKPATNGSVERGKLRSGRETLLPNKALPTDGPR